jgi:hypothetical protein
MDKYKLKYVSNTLRLVWKIVRKQNKPLSDFAIALIDELTEDFHNQLNKYLER